MRTKIINKIEHTHSDDYLAAPIDTEIIHVLVNINTGEIVKHDKITYLEMGKKIYEPKTNN